MKTLQNKFNSIAHIMQIKDEDLKAVAETFFFLGAGYALSEEPDKLCRLVAMSDSQQVIFGKTLQGVRVVERMQNEKLSQQDLQYLSHVLRNILNEFSEHTEIAKRAVNYYWERSEVDSAEGSYNFNQLNNTKDILRDIKQHSKKMAGIQRKIKSKLRK